MTNLELIERALKEAVHNLSRKDNHAVRGNIKFALDIIADMKKEDEND